MNFAGVLNLNIRQSPVCRFPLHKAMAAIFGAAILAAIGTVGGVPQARAQAILESVNGRPITDIDIEQRMKLLKVLRQPSTRDAAIQSLVDDQLKLQETSLYQIKPDDSQIGQQISRAAAQMKIAPDALVTELQRAGISDLHIKEHFGAEVAFYALIEAMHKGVEASETQIRAELAKEGGKAADTEYRLHQVIFVIPTSIARNPEALKGRMEAAEQLRLRFTDCASGLPLARGMDNVAVKDQIISSAARLSPALKQMFDKTPVGHLTPPQRSSEGIEMIAICSKSASNDDTALRTEISQRLLSAGITQGAAERLKELRAHAVIVKK